MYTPLDLGRFGIYVVVGLQVLAWVASCSPDKPVVTLAEQELALVVSEVTSALADHQYDRAWMLISTTSADPSGPHAKAIKRLRATARQKYILFHSSQASSLKDSGRLRQAQAHISKVLAVEKDNSFATGMQEAIRKQQAEDDRVVQSPVEAQADKQATSPGRTSRQQDPEVARLIREGQDHLQRRQYRQALGSFTEVQRLDSRNCAALLNLGIVYARLLKGAKSAAHYRQFVWFCPRHKMAPRVRGILRKFEARQQKRR